MKRKHNVGYANSDLAPGHAKRMHGRRRSVAIPRPMRIDQGSMIPGYRSVPASFTSPKGEVKAVDLSVASYPFSADLTNTNVFLLNGVQEGTGFYNRIGRKIEMRSLHIRGSITVNALTSTTPDFLKWAIVYDRQPNGALPTYQQIFQLYDQQGNTHSDAYSEVNLDERDRFMIIRHKSYNAPTQSVTYNTPAATIGIPVEDQQINEFIKLKRLTTHFNGTANPLTITNIVTGSLYLVTQGIKAVAGAPFAMNVAFRLRYDDL